MAKRTPANPAPAETQKAEATKAEPTPAEPATKVSFEDSTLTVLTALSEAIKGMADSLKMINKSLAIVRENQIKLGNNQQYLFDQIGHLRTSLHGEEPEEG